jgi:hypothetical protein
MRAWPVHCVFAVILVGSLLAKNGWTDVFTKNRSVEAAVIDVARSHGWAFRDYTKINDTDIPTLAFQAPGCNQPVLVIVLLVAFDQEPVVRSARESGYGLRYFYINRAWDAPHRLAVFLERTKYAALAIFGLTPYVPSSDVLLVESPLNCQVAHDVDWRSVWSRDYSSLVEADAKATTR